MRALGGARGEQEGAVGGEGERREALPAGAVARRAPVRRQAPARDVAPPLDRPLLVRRSLGVLRGFFHGF